MCAVCGRPRESICGQCSLHAQAVIIDANASAELSFCTPVIGSNRNQVANKTRRTKCAGMTKELRGSTPLICSTEFVLHTEYRTSEASGDPEKACSKARQAVLHHDECGSVKAQFAPSTCNSYIPGTRYLHGLHVRGGRSVDLAWHT